MQYSAQRPDSVPYGVAPCRPVIIQKLKLGPTRPIGRIGSRAAFSNASGKKQVHSACSTVPIARNRFRNRADWSLDVAQRSLRLYPRGPRAFAEGHLGPRAIKLRRADRTRHSDAEHKWSEVHEDAKERTDAPIHHGKARPHCSGGCGTFFAGPDVPLQGDQRRSAANPKVWHAHDHHAGRFGLLLGKPARKIRTA
jgi:hypothetical protein